MAEKLVSYFNKGTYSKICSPGKQYKVIVIGHAGDGAEGGSPQGYNSSTSGVIKGAQGAGGGAGAFVYVKEFTVDDVMSLGITVTDDSDISLTMTNEDDEIVSSVVIPKSGSGVGPVPGNSVAPADSDYTGSFGGGAGGPRGLRGTTTVEPMIRGGQGDMGNGANSTVGTVVTTTSVSNGNGGTGGGNVAGEGLGGKGAQENGLVIDINTIKTITAQDIASKMYGGNGTDGTKPANRPAVTGISAAKGAGGGGAWTSGTEGTNPTGVGQNLNGKGGAGGIGGFGGVWIWNS